jgi:hypothetical protein
MASLPGTTLVPASLPPSPPEVAPPALDVLAPDDEDDVAVDDGDSPEPPQPREKAMVARQTVSR